MADGAQSKPQIALNPTVDFLGGTLAGIAGLVTSFPFDTLKVRLQTPEMAGHYEARSTFQAIATIVREERVAGLYRGIASPLLTVALMNGLVFASYKFLLKLQLGDSDSVASLTQIALAGAGSGIVSSIVTTPTELIKIRQQQQVPGATMSARGVAVNILKSAGVRGLYRGGVATALRDCGYGGYFAAYEATSRYFGADMWQVTLLAGGVAGIIGWLVTFPLDVVKTRVQGSGAGLASACSSVSPLLGEAPTANPYRTTTSAIVNSYRAEGLKVFYRGLAPTLIRAVPVNMVTFGVFEAVVSTLG